MTHKSRDYFRVLILRTVGNFLIISSLFFIGKTFYKPVKEEIRYFIEKKFNKKYVLVQSSKLGVLSSKLEIESQTLRFGGQRQGLLAKIFRVKPVEIMTPVDSNFSIVIPKIGANAKIIDNVDVSDEKAYLEALNLGVAQAAGTAHPGEEGHIFLFAHSTDYIWNVGSYNAVFYLLGKLKANDQINIFYQGHRYLYKVIGKKIVDPSQVEYLTRQTNKEFLTLQTCWPLGTTFQRLLVFATRIAE